MLGLKRKMVKLLPHQKQWHSEFLKEKSFLKSILGDNIAIEHVGSTAIEGLHAKPILDIVIGFTADIKHTFVSEILSENGYEDRGDDGVKGENLFVKGDENNRTHYIHVVNKDSTAWNNYILFRDYLREHKSAREEYSLLKQDLAKKFPKSREAYTNGKTDFINMIIRKVREDKSS